MGEHDSDRAGFCGCGPLNEQRFEFNFEQQRFAEYAYQIVLDSSIQTVPVARNRGGFFVFVGAEGTSFDTKSG